jgi:enolase
MNICEGRIRRNPIFSVEDGLAEDEWTGLILLNKSLGEA